jgi:ankyrin repeat protein
VRQPKTIIFIYFLSKFFILTHHTLGSIEPTTICDFAANGDLERVQILLEKGADPNFVDDNGLTALHMAADRGHIEITRLLLNQGANVNAQDLNGDTPLHNACLCEHKDIIVLLLGKGADKSTKNTSGETPIDAFDFSTLQ